MTSLATESLKATTKPFDRVIARLDGVRGNNGSRMARCPAHDDRNQSLSVTDSDDGHALLFCHAGCSTQAIVDALGMSMSDLFADGKVRADTPTKPKPKRGKTYPTPERAALAALWSVQQQRDDTWRQVNAWAYHDHGIEYARVLRFEPPDGSDKTVRPIYRDGDDCRVGDPPRWLPLGVDDLRSNPDQTIYVVEGEPCRDAAASIGLLAITSAHGSKSAAKTDWSDCAGRDVAIWPDKDKPGKQYADDVAGILAKLEPPARVRIIEPPEDLPDGGDLADWIDARECVEPDDLRAEVEAMAARSDVFQTENVGPVDGLILDPQDHYGAAEQFVSCHYTSGGRTTIVDHDGTLRKWSGPSWTTLDDATIRSQAWKYQRRARKRVKSRSSDEVVEVPYHPNSTSVNNMLDATRAIVHLPSDTIAPAWLDGRSGPPAHELLPFTNHLYHLPTGRTYTHTPELFNLHSLVYAHNPAAGCPQWLAFLNALWPDDAEAIESLQRWFGYCLTVDTWLEKILLIVGPKRSGKGTIARVLTALLGQANVCGPTLASLSGPFGLQPLIDKLVAIVGDARLSGRADQASIAERLLAISGEDGLTVARKYQKDWHGKLPTRFMLLSNELPRIADASGALASRFIILTMSESFYGREDHHLTDKLMAELPGIANWAIDGWGKLNRDKCIQMPASSAEAVDDLHNLGSPVSAFVHDCCVVGPENRATIDDLYRAWRDWCMSEGREHPGSRQTFGRDLRSAVPGLKMTRPRDVSGARVRAFDGIGLI